MKTLPIISIPLLLTLSLLRFVPSGCSEEEYPRVYPDLLLRYAVGDTMASNPIANNEGPKTLVAIDLNHDGLDDVIAGNLDGSLSVLLGQTNNSLSEQILHRATNLLYHASLRGLAAADFDGDGQVDVAAADIASKRVLVLRGQGDGSLIQIEQIPTGPARALAAADFNTDGKSDLLLACAPPDCDTACANCGKPG